jgi:hypothetical protein
VTNQRSWSLERLKHFISALARNSNAEGNSRRLLSADDSVPIIPSWGSFQELFGMQFSQL